MVRVGICQPQAFWLPKTSICSMKRHHEVEARVFLRLIMAALMKEVLAKALYSMFTVTIKQLRYRPNVQYTTLLKFAALAVIPGIDIWTTTSDQLVEHRASGDFLLSNVPRGLNEWPLYNYVNAGVRIVLSAAWAALATAAWPTGRIYPGKSVVILIH